MATAIRKVLLNDKNSKDPSLDTVMLDAEPSCTEIQLERHSRFPAIVNLLDAPTEGNKQTISTYGLSTL